MIFLCGLILNAPSSSALSVSAVHSIQIWKFIFSMTKLPLVTKDWIKDYMAAVKSGNLTDAQVTRARNVWRGILVDRDDEFFASLSDGEMKSVEKRDY